MFIDLQDLENLENILARLVRSACQNADVSNIRNLCIKC